jgi:hypothetical protein
VLHNCQKGKRCDGGICKYTWGGGGLEFGRKHGLGKKKLILGVRACSPYVGLCVNGICTCIPRTGRVKEKKAPLETKESKTKTGQGHRWANKARDLSAARDALAFTSVFLDIHRVLRMLILMCTTRRPRAPATRSRTGSGRPCCGRRVVREHHHGMPTFRTGGYRQRERNGKRLCRTG